MIGRATLPALCALLALVVIESTVSDRAAVAGPLEQETQEILAQFGQTTNLTKLILRLGDIGCEARAAIPMLKPLINDEKYCFDAGFALANMGGESISTFQELLKSNDPKIRLWAAFALRLRPDDAAPLIPRLIEMLDDSDSSGGKEAHEVLAGMRAHTELTIPALAARLSTDDCDKALAAALALMELGPIAKAALPALEIAAHQHAHPAVRTRCLYAMIEIDGNGERTIRALVRGLRDDMEASAERWIGHCVQPVAVHQLTRVCSRAPQAAPILLDLLKSDRVRERFWLYEPICFSLGALRSKEAIPQLELDLRYQQQKRAGNPQEWMGRPVPPDYATTCVRATAAAALIEIRPDDQQNIRYLQSILADEKWSAVALAGGKGLMMTDPRCIAATGLGRLGTAGTAALPALRQAMDDGKQEKVRLAGCAAWAIARIDPSDRQCLDTLAQSQSVFPPMQGDSPDGFVRILGPRMNDLLPEVIDRAIAANHEQPYLLDVLAIVGDSALKRLVERAFFFLEDPAEAQSLEANRLLDKMNDRAKPAIDVLIEKSRSDQHLIRAKAARLLGVVGKDSASAIEALRQMLSDERVLVRARAAEALGRIGRNARSAVEELQQRKSDEYEWVRDTSSQALTAIEQN